MKTHEGNDRQTTLMFGWTTLLIWAYRRPGERRFVAALTVLVIWGLVLAEVVAVRSGVISAWRMAPTWSLQAALLLLFASAYHYPASRVTVHSIAGRGGSE